MKTLNKNMMKYTFTHFKKPAVFLLFLVAALLGQQARAQKLMTNYPVPNGDVKAFAQRGDTVFMAGNFTGLNATAPQANLAIFNNAGDAMANPLFNGVNGGGVNLAVPDDAGGWYIAGKFTEVKGQPRGGLAHINADGTLNAWNPPSITNQFDETARVNINAIAISGDKVFVAGNFAKIGTKEQDNLAAFNATTGELLEWNAGVLSGQTIEQMQIAGSMLYVKGQAITNIGGQDRHGLAGINVSDGKVTSFNPKISVKDGDAETVVWPTAMLVSGNKVYLTGAFNQYYADIYVNDTKINAGLFAVDATTGALLWNAPVSFPALGDGGDMAINNNTLYLCGNFTAATNAPRMGLAAFNAGTGELLPWNPINAIESPDYNPAKIVKIFTLNNGTVIPTGNFYTLNGQTASNNLLSIDPITGAISPWNINVNAAYNIRSVVQSGDKILIGGGIASDNYNPKPFYFNSGASIERKGLAAFSMSTGKVLNWNAGAMPDASSYYSSLAIQGNTLYAGGAFAKVDDIDRKNLVAIDINTAKVLPDFAPDPDNSVNTLLISNNKLYAGGAFIKVKEQTRNYVAAIDLTTGTPDSWDAGIQFLSDDFGNTGIVNALAKDEQNLYIGGNFNMISGQTRKGLASFDLSTGSLGSLNPNLAGALEVIFPINVRSILPKGTVLYIGGSYFDHVGDDARNNTAAIDKTTGKATGFSANADADVFTLSLQNNTLYVGGDINVIQDNIFRTKLAALDISTDFTRVLDFNPILDARVNQTFITPYYLFAGVGAGAINKNAGHTGLAVYQVATPPAVITFVNLIKTYGDADASPAATSNNTAVPITYALSEQKDAAGNEAIIAEITAEGNLHILMPGTAKLTASQLGNSEFPAATDVTVTLTINKALLNVASKDVRIVTGQSLADLPFSLSGWKFTDADKTEIYSGKPEFTTTATTTSPVGTYPVSVSGAGTLTSAYYSFTPASGNATITITATGDKPQTITFPAVAAKNYGDADFDLGGTTDADGLTLQYTSSDPAIATITNGKLHITGAGTVTITAAQAGSITYASATPVPQTFTVNRAALTIKADDKIKNRGDVVPVLTATYTGLVNGDKPANLTTQPTIATTATTNSFPGSYPITVADAASPNYEITYVNGTMTVKGTQIITFAPLSTLTYGDASFSPGATSDAGANLTPVYTTSNPNVIAISGNQAVIKGAGSAIITATFAATNGFDLTTATLPVTVLKKQLSVKAEDKTRNYGEANPALTVNYNGFVNNDTYLNLTTQPQVTTTATATSPVGIYLITVSGAASNNYDIIYAGANLTVNAVARTITFNALPTKTYGDADFNPAAATNTGETVTYTVADPSIASVTPSGQLHLTGAGTTTITATLPVNNGYTGPTVATQNLIVNKAHLTITADNKNKTQGPPDVLLTASFSGFVSGDTFLNLTTSPTLTTTAKADSPTGNYPITVSGATSPSYDITYVNGTLAIIFGVGQDQLVVHPMLSPNGDGKNDYLLIDGIQNYPDNHVLVVNRNGAKVYEAKGYDNSSIVFSGKNNDGNSLVAGTYYYEINYSLKGNTQRKTGYVIIKY